MRHAQENNVSQASPLGALLVAWIIVTGLAIVPIALWAKQHDDIIMLIAFCVTALTIGIGLFIAMGLARMGARARDHEEGRIADVTRRGAVFGKR